MKLPKYEAEVLKSYADTIGGQGELAQHLGVHRVTLVNWLNQNKPCGRYDELITLAHRLLIAHPEIDVPTLRDDLASQIQRQYRCDPERARKAARILSKA